MPGRRKAPAPRSRVPASARGRGGGPQVRPIGAGDYTRFMLYSFPGWRKTSFLATGAEAGMKTLIVRSPLDQIPKRALKSGAEEIVVNNWEDMMGNSDSVLDFLRYSDHGYEWVWLDCLSIIQDVLLDDVWAATIAEKPGRAYKLDNQGKIAGMNLSPTSGMDRGEYGRNMERIQQWIRHVVGANSFNFGMTAHPYEGPHPTNDEGGDLLQPWIQGKGMIPKICGYCNVIAFQEIKEGEDENTWHRMHFRENSRFYAKDLYDAFPNGYLGEQDDPPNMTKFMAAIEASKTGKSTAGRKPGRRGRREQK